MTPMLTLREFIEKVSSDHGVEFKEREEPITGPRGDVILRYLQRDSRIVPLVDIDEGEVLTPTVLRSLCQQLDIPCEEFGFELG